MNATNIKLAIWAALAALTLGNAPAANAADKVYETQEITPVAGFMAESFGGAVAVSGFTAAVISQNSNKTRIYIERATGLWLERATLNPYISDFNSTSVAITGPNADGIYTVAVGGWSQRTYGGPVVIVFEGSGAFWKRKAVLLAPPSEQAPHVPIALDGDRVAAAGDNAVYVYRKLGKVWTRESELIIDARLCDRCMNDRSIALTGTTLYVGDPEGSGAADFSGVVHIYGYGHWATPSPIWMKLDTVQASDGESGDGFGAALDVDGGRVLVGAPWADGATDHTGVAYVFYRSGDNWMQEAKLVRVNGERYERFGNSVALDGSVAVIGTETFTGRGSAHVFTSGSKRYWQPLWTEQLELVPSMRQAEDAFGYSVAIEGNTILVGAPNRHVNLSFKQGSAFVFTCSTDVRDCWKYQ